MQVTSRTTTVRFTDDVNVAHELGSDDLALFDRTTIKLQHPRTQQPITVSMAELRYLMDQIAPTGPEGLAPPTVVSGRTFAQEQEHRQAPGGVPLPPR